VLFDLDGTLADSEPLIARVQLEVLQEHGFDVTAADFAPLASTPFPQKMAALGIPAPHEPLDEEYRRRYADRLGETPAIDGAATLLAALHQRGTACAIVSNKVEDGAVRLIDAFGWTPYFAVVAGRDTTDDGSRKPDPGPALLALGRMGVAASDAWFVGDAADDMACGHAAGCSAMIGLTRTHPEADLRTAGATHICGSLAEVAELLGVAIGAAT
jgi:phosphoglycolate phosphatase-like HAD superfamily hydrolase